MRIRTIISSLILSSLAFSLIGSSADNSIVSIWVSCEGTVVTRSDIGRLEISRVAPNSPGCRGPKVWTSDMETSSLSGATGSTSFSGQISSGSIDEMAREVPRGEILFDLAQTDIVNYRLERMRQNQIRYANAIRSVRMRNAKSKESTTVAYLMKNDAVITDGATSGWVKTQGTTLDLLDPVENTIVADTTGKADGYIAAKYLRDANPSDLVRIRQADNAYWSDLAHVNADRYLNVRAHPWPTAPIVTTIGRDTVLYVVSTIDDWSEVMTDDRSIRGYVKSKFLTIDKAQRVEQDTALLK